MSGIYIPGMEMPATMSILAVFPNGYVAVYDSKDTFIGEAKAIPVPDHGRLIDADALIPMMKYATTDSEIGVFPIKIGFNAIIEVINNAPTIDAEPVRHGKWELAEDGWYCSACELYPPFDCDPEEKGIPYCPYCGARMDEDERD